MNLLTLVEEIAARPILAVHFMVEQLAEGGLELVGILVVIVELLVPVGKIAPSPINAEVGLHEVSAQFNFQLPLGTPVLTLSLSDIHFLIERITLFGAKRVKVLVC